MTGTSRFATLPQNAARLGLSILIATLTLAILFGLTNDFKRHESKSGIRDAELYAAVARATGEGESYYVAAAREHRNRGYPLRPVVTVRMPTLAWVRGYMGLQGAGILLSTIALLGCLGWYRNVRGADGLGVAATVATLIGVSSASLISGPPVEFHECWAALLITLAIPLTRPSTMWLAAIIALIAALIRETSMPFLVMMFAAMLFFRRWKDAFPWALSLGVWSAAFAIHANNVSEIATKADLVSQGWGSFGGWALLTSSIQSVSPLTLLPGLATGPVLILSLFGWLSWKTLESLWVTGWITGISIMIMAFARPDNFYWATLIAPLCLGGLAFAPRALADLWKSCKLDFQSK